MSGPSCHLRTQLKASKGFRESVIGVNFLISIFCLAVWFAIVTHKLHLLNVIYSAYPSLETLSIMSLVPPVGAALLYCLVVSTLELVLGCPRNRRLAEPERSLRQAPRAGRDTVIARDSSDEEDERGCKLPEAVPLSVSALLVTGIQIIEAVIPIFVAFRPLSGQNGLGWGKTFIAGLILKYLLYEITLFLAEGVLQSRCWGRVAGFFQFLSLWVHANRMFRDMFISGFILCTLFPFVMLDTFNAMLCRGCSLHNLLIYRDPGHLAKEAAVIHYTEEESEDEERSTS
eukprot:Skav213134  [mRNA]  locus=scaffold107:331633:346271:+ [translate_table: standard]